MYKKSLLYVGSKSMSNNQFYSLGWNKLILHHNYGGGGRIWTFDLRVMSPAHCNNISYLSPKTWYNMVQHSQNGTTNGTTRLSVTPDPRTRSNGVFCVLNSHLFFLDFFEYFNDDKSENIISFALRYYNPKGY